MSETMVRNGQYTRTQGFGMPKRDAVQPRFHMEPVLDEAATAEQGRPIYRNQERVQFMIPGGLNAHVALVTNEHREQYKEAYEAFKRGEEQSVTGTPLEQWPVVTRAMVLELKAMGVFTVEQAATLADTAVQRIGRGGYALRDRAKAYLDEAEALAFSERLNRENELLNSRLAAAERQLAEQKEIMDRLHAQMMAAQNAPHPLATHIPGMHDPVELARQARPMEPAGDSSLAGLGEVKRRAGRPTNAEVAARAAQGGQ